MWSGGRSARAAISAAGAGRAQEGGQDLSRPCRRKLAGDDARPMTGRFEERLEEEGSIQGIARPRDQGPARAAQDARIGLDADPVSDEDADPIPVETELRGPASDVGRIGAPPIEFHARRIDKATQSGGRVGRRGGGCDGEHQGQ